MTAEELTSKVFNKVFRVDGMTCESCVKTITEKISAIPDVSSVQVNLKDKSAEILSNKKIEIAEVRQALIESPKYSVSEFKHESHLIAANTVEEEKSIFKTYKPLFTLFAFIVLISASYQISISHFNSHIFMNHLMAGFFVGLSFFKFLDLKAFAESFSSYDPVAQRWLGYGKIYPFVELLLGLLFVSGKFLFAANTVTILVLSLTTYGVYLRLQSKSKFQCACLGTTFNLPLSNVTIAENVVMILMAIYSLSKF
jgi:copper chaperone CopZ